MIQTKDIKKLLTWYRENKRDLPWRHTKDPYRIWVSEIMLQQTRVEAVKPYYAAFLERYPDAKSLAGANEDDLVRIWEGLGYYSRVRNMHKAAMEVQASHGGLFPVSYEVLLTLPGIGSYTAGAVSSIAGGENVPAVDGNVLRVYTRITADDAPVDETKNVKRIREELQEVMENSKRLTDYDPGDFNAAFMELGATVCLPNGEPKCAQCPLRAICAAYKAGNPTEYPKKAPKAKRRIENRTVFVLESSKGIALKKGTSGRNVRTAIRGRIFKPQAGRGIHQKSRISPGPAERD